MTKVGLISTRQTNIGDDLIRAGIQQILQCVLPESDLQYVLVNKHEPLEVFRNHLAAQAIRRLPRGRRIANRAAAKIVRPFHLPHLFEDTDFIVQCGTPMMWPECHKAEWLPVMWGDVLVRETAPVFSLATGSCYPWVDSRPPTLMKPESDALTNILATADLLTFRDQLAQDVARRLGFNGRLLPCTAMHWTHGTHADVSADFVIVNVMPRGGHFIWGQRLIASEWHREIDRIVSTLAKDHPLILLCHDAIEYDFAKRWPAHERCLVRSPEEYLAVARRGRIGVVNRMHAAVALAGLGIPALAVGTDTRLLMVDEVGQETMYLGDVTTDRLLEVVESLLAEQPERRERLLKLEADSFVAHVAEVAIALGHSSA